ncbi:hypothetical protein PYCCODRAFT_1394711 [Trametes coccinea BRFM310]|uniref:MYND-type domain-containing protein n=1 Tax=Trametes coccinea (strain BRFM310) TaxID=1353009 RepID=A0A1Y2IET4_TRAC3|nr:hypothetical protein PYCCODRAFT_1394711 [Trametes coccinea BRFM310]
MAALLFWSGKYYFYPVGNTSAVSLTRDIPPGVSANLLLLPCGDPRNVLYTVYCESAQMPRKLDFTCCDYDPGILARDSLLFAMIMDGVPQEAMWDIFFHLYLNDRSLSALATQCRRLVACASTLDSWHASSYGKSIRISSEYTLQEIRRLWNLYLETSAPGCHRMQELRRQVDSRREANWRGHKDGVMWSSARSSGPLITHSVLAYSQQFHHYWETGTTSHSREELPHVNPTFLQSRAGEGFHVHYGTDPLVPFHLASYFGNHKTGSFSPSEMVSAARSQFQDWCQAFRARVRSSQTSSPLVVRFLLGDVICIAHALNERNKPPTSCPSPSIPVAPWTAQPTVLSDAEYRDCQAPILFDVIDTSNVSDHVGLLNILLVTVPLLSTTSTWGGVLYTESLLAHRADATTQITSILPADLSAVAMMFGLCPIDALSGFSTICNTHELLTNALSSAPQFHQSITWKRPYSCDPQASRLTGSHIALDLDSEQLAAFLFKVYDRLFAADDAMRVYQVDLTSMQRAWLSPYSRETFAVFLQYLRSKPFAWFSEHRWSQVVMLFLARLGASLKEFPYDNLWRQDLLVQLYRRRTFTPSTFRQTPSSPISRISQWHSIPPIVRIYLTVPSDKFAVLRNPSTASTPPLICVIRANGILECGFQSVDAVFGNIVETGTAAKPAVEVREAPGGLNAGINSSVIVSFVVPTWLLTKAASPDPDALIVDFCMKSTSATVTTFMKTLGLRLAIFSAPLSDTQRVHIVPEDCLPPVPPPTASPIPPSQSDLTIGEQTFTRADLDSIAGSAVVSLTARLDLRDPDSKTKLANGAFPTITQPSPYTMRVSFGNRTQDLFYPLPIIGAQHKARLARKSSYIEVVAPVAMPFPRAWAMESNPFPVVRIQDSRCPMPWNIHRLALDRLPAVETPSPARLHEWLNPHVGSQLSRRDRRSRAEKDTTNLLALMKDTIHCIMVRSTGTQGGAPSRVLALRDEALGEGDTIFFVDKLRYDVSAHTVVCDAFVLTLNEAVVPFIHAPLKSIARKGLESVRIFGDELRAWKQLLPALVERCRASWEHQPNCEYVTRGKIPLETALNAGDPLCACGRGKDIDGMRRNKLWKNIAPYVTRIALSPLFAVSYLEPVIDASTFNSELESSTQAAQTARSLPTSSFDRPASASKEERCNKCSKKGDDLLRCSRCKTVFYCSQGCQRADWMSHKAVCKPGGSERA